MQKNYALTAMSFTLAVCLSACTTTPEKSAIKEIAKPVVITAPSSNNLNLGLLRSLIGKWKVQDWQIQKNGEWQEQAGATWDFYAIQGNTAIRDEWKSNTNNTEHTPGFGSQLRVYDPWGKTWSAAWLSSRSRSLDFYTGRETEDEVFFVTQANEKGRTTRVIFSNIQENSFNWQMQWSSNDGESWTSVYKLVATRSGN